MEFGVMEAVYCDDVADRILDDGLWDRPPWKSFPPRPTTNHLAVDCLVMRDECSTKVADNYCCPVMKFF